MHAFITGATGFLGQHLTRELKQQGWQMTALCRDLTAIEDYAVDGIHWVQGQLQDLQSLRRCVPEGVDAIFHLAGDTSTWRKHQQRLYQINVLGTQNLARVALEKHAGRFIHTSTIGVYGFHDGLIDENSEKRAMDSAVPYFHTKYLAEEVIFEHIKKGLDAVILNPAAIIGPYDDHNWIQLFDRLQAQDLPGIPPGRKSFCFAQDVAKAHIQAFVHGASGENYILGGPTGSFLDVCQWISEKMQLPKPTSTLSPWLLKTIGCFNSKLRPFARTEPGMTLEKASIICGRTLGNSDKARRDLQYRTDKSLAHMLQVTYDWWLEQKKPSAADDHKAA